MQPRRSLLWPCSVAIAVFCLAAGSARGGEPTPAAATAAELPRVLTPEDAQTYRRIFAAQADGDWKTADKAIPKVKDPLLMGHVLGQRYLHPATAKVAYPDLKSWLDAYADHPDAKKIHDLAIKLKPRAAPAPRRPVGAYLQGSGYIPADVKFPYVPNRSLPKAQAREAAQLKIHIRQALRHGPTPAARKLFQGKDFARLLSRQEQDFLSTDLATAYFIDGQDEAALELAATIIRRSPDLQPETHWTAGLAAWRLGRPADSAKFFEAVANHPCSSSWMISAGAFWAARAHLVARRPAVVNQWLEMAARHPRTFYGLLARHILGIPMPFNWNTPTPAADEIARIAAEPAGKRAFALIQAGEINQAERELRMVAGSGDAAAQRAILVVAAQVNMPALTTRIDSILAPRGDGFDGAAFPIPAWRPDGGYSVDRALVFALIRQESGFNPNALSSAGAAGLMQLMPGTASFVAGDGAYQRSAKKQLHDPDLNLRLGQKYMEMLLDDDPVNGDLFLFAAAWNGGPGNLKKWLRSAKADGDALLFIETIPLRETRIFVERVLANLWIYRHRFGQDAPSLEAVAAGAWPAYMAQDTVSTMVARNVED